MWENKKRYGTSISEHPEFASLRLEEGHWEGDTVVGKRAGKESVVFSLLEKKTETYLAFRIPGTTSEAVMNLMNELHDEYGEHCPQIFKTITVDNGSEFADFAKVEKWGNQSLLRSSLHSLRTSPKRASQWAVPSLRAQGCFH